jgi:hypothetical protein
LGNTYTTISMNLKHAFDVSAIAAAMLLRDEEKEVLGVLAVGSAVVKLQGRWPRAFRVQIPYKAIPKGRITDAALSVLMKDSVIRAPVPVTEAPTPVDDGDSGTTWQAILFVSPADMPA